MAETQPSCDLSHWVFSRADCEQVHDLCLERITEDILEEADPLHSFVKHITKATNDSIPRATTITKKSNPWFDEECWEAMKATRALDKSPQSREFRGETLSAFRRSQLQARWRFNQKKRQSWTEYVSKLSTNLPPKQYLNGKDGAAITNPIANEHAAAFTDNFTAHHSAAFQTIKGQEKVKIDFTPDSTEVYNKPLHWEVWGSQSQGQTPCAWTWQDPQQSVETSPWGHTQDPKSDPKQDMDLYGFSSSVESSNGDPDPKTKQDHTDPLSYRPIALTSCLWKILEQMINTRINWYLE